MSQTPKCACAFYRLVRLRRHHGNGRRREGARQERMRASLPWPPPSRDTLRQSAPRLRPAPLDHSPKRPTTRSPAPLTMPTPPIHQRDRCADGLVGRSPEKALPSPPPRRENAAAQAIASPTLRVLSASALPP